MERIGMHFDFDDDDAKVISFLVDHFDEEGEHFRSGDVSMATQLPVEKVTKILERFWRYQLVSRLTRADDWKLEPQLLSVADQLRGPDPAERDYPKDVEKWFRSKWWSVPVWGIFVILPALVGYVTIVPLT